MYIKQVVGSMNKIHEILAGIDTSDIIYFNELNPNHFSVVYNDRKAEYMTTLKPTAYDYLFEIEYKDTDYNYDDFNSTEDVKKHKYDTDVFGCSSIRIGNFLGRNLDWYDTDGVDFVVKVKKTDKIKHSSIGVATVTPEFGITRCMIKKGVDNNAFRLLPLKTMDGINDAGVVVNTNVVPAGDDIQAIINEYPLLSGLNHTYGTNPGKKDMFISVCVRYILDYADSVDDAVELLKNKNIFGLNNKECHLMISDANKTVVVEFAYNKMIVIDYSDLENAEYGTFSAPNSLSSNFAVMTNFYLTGFDGDIKNIRLSDVFESRKEAAQPEGETEGEIEESTSSMNSSLTPHAMGLERYYDLYTSGAALINADSIAMKEVVKMMKNVWYSNAYVSGNAWYSEFSYDYNKDPILSADYPIDLNIFMDDFQYDNENKITQEELYNIAISTAITTFNENRWITTHTSIYDIENKELLVIARESPCENTYMKYSIKDDLDEINTNDSTPDTSLD